MNILTFDIEDWFHILDNDSTRSVESWSSFSSRIEQNLDYILSTLSDKNLKASFFVLGWIGEKYPHLVKRISDEGHEIGSHTTNHALLFEYNKNEISKNIKNSLDKLEQIVGNKITLFRAPGFSIKESNQWVFEILIELGIEVDSSIFPTTRAHGGFENFPYSDPCIIKVNGVTLKEFPINKADIFGKEIIFSGGGYFRFFPFFIQKKLYTDADYVMTYFHPRDFDSGQPMLKGLSLQRRFKSYYGLKNSKQKFEKLLSSFSFIDLKKADETIDWNKVPIYEVS